MGEAEREAAPAVVAAYSQWLDSKDSETGGYALSFAMERLAPRSAAEADAVRHWAVRLSRRTNGPSSLAAKALGKFGKAAAPAVPRLRALKEKAPSAQARAAAATSLDAIEGVAVSQPEAK